MQTASDLICRLRELEADRQRIELSQALLQGEVRAFSHEVARAAQSDPAILHLLQAEARALLPPVAPLLPPEQLPLDSGDFVIGTFDEDFVLPSTLPYLALSPPFGATDDDVPAPTFLPLVDVPDLSFPDAALPIPMIAQYEPWGAPVPPSSVSTSAPSNFSSSPPSSFCSPVFSPMDVAASSFGTDWTSSHYLSGPPFATINHGASSSGDLALVPPLFAPASFDEHLEALLAGSSTLERVPSQAGRVKCESQAGDVRFDPLATSAGVRRRQSSFGSSTSPDIPVSPELKPASSKSSSLSSKARSSRRVVKGATSCIAVKKNDEHMFAVYIQGVGKTDETSLARLYLDHSSLDPTSPLGCTVTGDTAYTASSFARDCESASVYSFFTASRAQWVVEFSLSGPTIAPVTSSTSGPITMSSTTTFVHFLPGDLVVSPSLPLGSREWWRQQECRGAHAGYPGGAWTARYDDEAAAAGGGAGGGGEKRRPARILGHFAKCCPVDDADGEWSLMKLARLMKK
ncbi:hypothetical protein JCM8208_002382 [Rhodotorula glutinis]